MRQPRSPTAWKRKGLKMNKKTKFNKRMSRKMKNAMKEMRKLLMILALTHLKKSRSFQLLRIMKNSTSL